MTEEQRNKTVEFILEQQAKVAVDLQQLAEANVAAEKRISRLEGALVTVAAMIGESNKRTDAKIAEQSAKWDETNERLDHFIHVLERYISEKQNERNGQSNQNGDQEAK